MRVIRYTICGAICRAVTFIIDPFTIPSDSVDRYKRDVDNVLRDSYERM